MTERVLCVKIASRGDLLQAGPAFRCLRETRPDAHLTLLVGASCEDVARHLPFFDEISVLDDRALLGSGWMGRLQRPRGAWAFYRLLRGYSEIIILHRDWRYAALAWLHGVPVRRGLSTGARAGFLTHPYHPQPAEHFVHRYLGTALGGEWVETPSLAGVWRFGEGERTRALEKTRALGLNDTSSLSIALGFGGGHNVRVNSELKTWPIDSFRELARRLAARGAQPVWVGDGHDARVLGQDWAGVNLAGRLTVPETAAVLSVCRRVVANDTMTLHLAEALGVPTVGLFGPTDPAHYRPLGGDSSYIWHGETLACSPCHRDGYYPPCMNLHRCMTDLSVERVLEKIPELK